jgi:hypothetical protein
MGELSNLTSTTKWRKVRNRLIAGSVRGRELYSFQSMTSSSSFSKTASRQSTAALLLFHEPPLWRYPPLWCRRTRGLFVLVFWWSKAASRKQRLPYLEQAVVPLVAQSTHCRLTIVGGGRRPSETMQQPTPRPAVTGSWAGERQEQWNPGMAARYGREYLGPAFVEEPSGSLPRWRCGAACSVVWNNALRNSERRWWTSGAARWWGREREWRAREVRGGALVKLPAGAAPKEVHSGARGRNRRLHRRITSARWTKPIEAFVTLGKKQGAASGPVGEEMWALRSSILCRSCTALARTSTHRAPPTPMRGIHPIGGAGRRRRRRCGRETYFPADTRKVSFPIPLWSRRHHHDFGELQGSPTLLLAGREARWLPPTTRNRRDAVPRAALCTSSTPPPGCIFGGLVSQLSVEKSREDGKILEWNYERTCGCSWVMSTTALTVGSSRLHPHGNNSLFGSAFYPTD